MSIAVKNELLFQYDQFQYPFCLAKKRGRFLLERCKKEGYNPKNNEHVLVDRRILHIDFELPMRDEYNLFINDLVNKYDNQDWVRYLHPTKFTKGFAFYPSLIFPNCLFIEYSL
jgi:hypothetical protein